MTQNIIDCKNLDRAGLESFAQTLGQPPFRGRQIMAWLYRPGIENFSQMTDLAKTFRALLPNHARISCFKEPVTEISEDGSIKFGFLLEDGQVIESVNIPEPDRNTLCISSQVGCAMECRFCQTGTIGFKRNLSPAEMVNPNLETGEIEVEVHTVTVLNPSETPPFLINKDEEVDEDKEVLADSGIVKPRY